MSKAPRSVEPGVQSITSVPESLDDDQARRAKVYLIQMGIRLVCFISAVFALTAGHALLGWLLAAGAVVLPYTAVVFVNAGPNRTPHDAQGYVPEPPGALAAAADSFPEATRTDEGGRQPASGTRHTVIDGDALLDGVRDEPVRGTPPGDQPRHDERAGQEPAGDEPPRDEPVEKKN